MDTKSVKTTASKPAVSEADQVDDTVQAPSKPKSKFVVYTGDATRRILSPEDWERVGLKGENNVWGFHNSFRVPAEDFTNDQIEYLTKTDGKFKVV